MEGKGGNGVISGILASAWHEAIPRRHSTRNYDDRPVSDELLNGLTPLLSGFAPTAIILG
jgi:hypothetical protein